MSAPRVVILGAGFGGLYAARALKRAPVQITVIDRRNHHLFQPLLYQVATASLAAPDIAAPIRKVLRHQSNARVLLAEAKSIDVSAKNVVLDAETITYDYLIVATGSTDSYFGHDDWGRYAPGLKSISDAFEIRRRILVAFECAERETDPARRQEWLTFVIVGAGPTGVELAGALKEIAQRTMAKDFRSFDPRDAKVILVDALDRVMTALPPPLSQRARALLEKIGVDVRTGERVTGIDAGGVTLGSHRIAARTVLWAAGVTASPLGRTLPAQRDRQGRVLVEPDLSIAGHPEVFVIGDLAAVRWKDGWVPGVAQPAIQEGRHAAACIVQDLAGRARQPFRYHDLGTLATIGRAAAVAQIGRFQFAGVFAWLVWLFIHIIWLVGFRNRIAVLLEWAIAYFTYHRSARVIMNEGPPVEPASESKSA
jgi:NADH dehydrogenase